MNKKNRLQDLKSLLHSIVPTIAGAPPQDQFRIRDMWEVVVGPHIAKKASPEGVRSGILYVNVESSVWMQELSFMKQQILERIHQVCESSGVKDIRFKLGKIQRGMDSSDEDLLPGLTEEELKRIERETIAIKDQEVRESLQGLFAAQVRRKDRRKFHK